MEDGPQQIDELKALVRRSIAVSEDTNRIVHGMRRSSRLKSFFWFILFAASIGSTYWFYSVYVMPRIAELQKLYGNVQNTTQQAQTLSEQLLNSLKNLTGGSTTKTP